MLISKYSKNWVKAFTDIKGELENVFEGFEYSIEHIGSTSVPHLDAKPIIDIDVIYSTPSDFGKIKMSLEKLGYYHNGDQGIRDREVFKRNGNGSNVYLDKIKHHLYVCPSNSIALERHLLSRNFLRKNEWARIKYQKIKYALAEEANQNTKVYAELKELYVNSFIDSIIEEEKRTYHL